VRTCGSPRGQSDRVRDPLDENRVVLVRGGLVPELPVGVAAPALCRAVGEEGARVVQARHDRGGWVGDGDALNLNRDGAVGARVVAELVVAVPTPALHGSIGEKRAGMVPTGRDRGRRIRRGDAGDLDRVGTIDVRPVPELTVQVVSPAPDGSAWIGEDRASVVPACCDRGGRRSGRKHPPDLGGHRADDVRVVPELVVAVPAPAPDRAGPEHRAGVIDARRRSGGGGDAGGRHGERIRDAGSVPDLSVEVVSPRGERSRSHRSRGSRADGGSAYENGARQRRDQGFWTPQTSFHPPNKPTDGRDGSGKRQGSSSRGV